MDAIKGFLSSGHLFLFLKKVREVSPLPPSCALMSVAEYASISLNIAKYP